MAFWIQHFEADFPQKVSLKILNSGIILNTFTHDDDISLFRNIRLFYNYMAEFHGVQKITPYHSCEGGMENPYLRIMFWHHYRQAL